MHAAARCLRAVRVPEHLPQLRHLVVVVGGRVGAIRPDLRALDAWVVRTHAGLERTRGADVAVTGILASGCVTPRLLTNRVVDLVRHPIAAPRIAVEWADIRDRRIRDVALGRGADPPAAARRARGRRARPGGLGLLGLLLLVEQQEQARVGLELHGEAGRVVDRADLLARRRVADDAAGGSPSGRSRGSARP